MTTSRQLIRDLLTKLDEHLNSFSMSLTPEQVQKLESLTKQLDEHLNPVAPEGYWDGCVVVGCIAQHCHSRSLPAFCLLEILDERLSAHLRAPDMEPCKDHNDMTIGRDAGKCVTESMERDRVLILDQVVAGIAPIPACVPTFGCEAGTNVVPTNPDHVGIGRTASQMRINMFEPSSIRVVWRRARLGTVWWDKGVDSINQDECFYCGWRDDRWSDDPYDRLFPVVHRKLSRPIYVCRNHQEAYGPAPVDCFTNTTIHDVRICPGGYKWWKERMDHDGRYWGHVVRRFVHYLPNWIMSHLDYVIVKAFEGYKKWRTPSEDST